MTKVNDTTLAFKAARRIDSIDGNFDYYDGLLVKTKVAGKFNMVFNWDPVKRMECTNT